MTSNRPRHVVSNNNPTRITNPVAPRMQSSLLTNNNNAKTNINPLKPAGRVPLQQIKTRNGKLRQPTSTKRVKLQPPVPQPSVEEEKTTPPSNSNFFYEDQTLSVLPKNISNIDDDDLWSCGMDCVRDNFFYLLYLEETRPLSPEYPHQGPLDPKTNKPTLITERMRTTLLDWTFSCCEKMDLNIQTTYLGVWILDQYLDACNSPSKIAARKPGDFQPKPVNKTNLQLVGTAAFVIASKYEECSFPTLDDWVFLCADSVTEKDIIAMEIEILQTLDFKLNAPTPIQFLRRFAKIVKIDREVHTIAKFFLESCSYSSELVKLPGHVRALACLHIASVLKETPSIWSKHLEYYSQLDEQTIQPAIAKVSRHMISMVANVHNRRQQSCKAMSVFKKYAREEHFSVALKPEVVACVVHGAQDLPRHERMSDSHVKTLPGKVVTIRVNPLLEKLSK